MRSTGFCRILLLCLRVFVCMCVCERREDEEKRNLRAIGRGGMDPCREHKGFEQVVVVKDQDSGYRELYDIKYYRGRP